MSAHDHHEEMHPPAPVWMYVTNFLVLVVLTIVTYFVATKDLGALSTPVALGIAVVKAGLVVLFFMHVFESGPLTKLTIFSSLFMVAVLCGFFLIDYSTRNLEVLPPEETAPVIEKAAKG